MTQTRILVVDENRVSAQMAQQAPTAQGHMVHNAANGEECLAQPTVRTADLIVSDLMMQDVGGYELCRRLRVESRTAEVPIILHTSRHGIREKRMRFEAGADD